MAKTQLEAVEVEKPHRCSLNCALIVKCPRLTHQKLLDSTTSQNKCSGRGRAHKIVTDDLSFNLFPTFATLAHAPKNTKLKKIYITTR